ncbi:MAG: sugar ABC transporter permease [Actinomycetales bacterium]|nr:MAG: sugar ABC transporter permease [Actinomycetales bacterium]
MTIGLSFTKWSGLGDPVWVAIANYTDQLADPIFIRSVINTVIIAVITVPVGLGLAIILARLINKRKLRPLYLALFFAPVVTSSIAVSLIWQQMLRQDGILSVTISRILGVSAPNWLGDPNLALIAVCMVAIWSSLGLNIVIFISGYQGISASILDAATVDGASTLRRFWSVELPMLSPIIFFSVVVAVISSFQTFDTVYVLTANAGPDNATRTIVYHIYDVGYRTAKMGLSSAASVVLLILTLAVTLVQFAGQKKLVHYDQ